MARTGRSAHPATCTRCASCSKGQPALCSSRAVSCSPSVRLASDVDCTQARLAGRLADTGLAREDVASLLALRGSSEGGAPRDAPPRVDLLAEGDHSHPPSCPGPRPVCWCQQARGRGSAGRCPGDRARPLQELGYGCHVAPAAVMPPQRAAAGAGDSPDPILWLNNLEQDSRYARWPRSLMDLLQPVFGGQVPVPPPAGQPPRVSKPITVAGQISPYVNSGCRQPARARQASSWQGSGVREAGNA